MYTLNKTLRSRICDLTQAANKAADDLEERLRPLFAAGVKLTEAGHSATADQATRPYRNMLEDWNKYRQNALATLDKMSRAELKKCIEHIEGFIATAASISVEPMILCITTGEEVAFRHNIGDLYSAGICERNELAKLIQNIIPIVHRQNPAILIEAAHAFDTFNSIERYGRVHTFHELEKLTQRIRAARNLIQKCTQDALNYASAQPN